MNDKRIAIAIVGGGFGGLYTALHLASRPEAKSGRWQLFLIEPKEHFLFTPLLYEVITGELQRWEIAPSYRQLLKDTGVKLINERAGAIDLENREIALERGGNLGYDYLVLAAGTKNRLLSIPGAAGRALTFRTMEDAETLNNAIHHLETRDASGFTIAVVGGGANGVELACKLADRTAGRGKILLLESGGEILKHFPPGVRRAGYRSLLAREVDIFLDTSIDSVTDHTLTLTRDGKTSTLPVDLLIGTAGTAAADLVTGLACERSETGKVLVKPSLQLLSYPEVFALGDMAQITGARKSPPATAQSAYQASTLVAGNIALSVGKKPLKPFRYVHLGDMLTLGRKRAIIACYGINLTGRIPDIIRRLVYILRLPTRQQQFRVLQHWFKNTVLKLSRSLRRQYEGVFSGKPVSPYEKNSRL